MTKRTLYSLIESPLFPDLFDLCQVQHINELRFDSMRKAISRLRTDKPDIVVGEFIYGYGNNYAGVNVSNLDVFLYSLQKYAPAARVMLVVEKPERQYDDKQKEVFDNNDILSLPVAISDLQAYIEM